MSADPGLRALTGRLIRSLRRDRLVQATTDELLHHLSSDRVLLYFFYRQWEGQVTFESLSDPQYSILGSTGPDDCFGDRYAEDYLAGRVRAIADVETEPIAECHRTFLLDLQVRANLVVPVLTERGLWGLLVAHHCCEPRLWSAEHIAAMQRGAKNLAAAPSVALS
ncbi:GAF domain protein [Rubidibacter lacunae KORDI 51-2]|uniref:GAF domain protein n=1 Tax=Rubidibacter lacunae KORDI 51-2 TaxID=582515 RepID=U5DPY1_9CHRO|nr:GAF domain-containing protein [Rubidibacter lacunae]ERN42659.1 GAF domain protein [Rubidibacter lacunae KORDI 51-2]